MNLLINALFPVGNAAGWCKTVDEVRNLARSAAEVIVVGSITVPERSGNPGNTFAIPLNSLGLPNMGIEKLKEIGPEMVRIAHEAGKKIILSIAGFDPKEYRQMARAAQEMGFDGIEINLGCPNVADGGKRKPIASLDLRLTEEIVGLSSSAVKMHDPDFFVSVKMSPMSNPLQIIDTAELLAHCNIDAIVTQNTFPNALLFNEDGTPTIQTPDKTGWAGFAGSAIKPMALGQVNQWRKALDSFGASSIEVWGVGGVETGKDVRDMIWAGASVVQVGTAYFTYGPKIFSDIGEQYLSL